MLKCGLTHKDEARRAQSCESRNLCSTEIRLRKIFYSAAYKRLYEVFVSYSVMNPIKIACIYEALEDDVRKRSCVEPRNVIRLKCSLVVINEF